MTEDSATGGTDLPSEHVLTELGMPAAEIRRDGTIVSWVQDPRFWSTWWLPIACLALAVGLVASSLRSRGLTIIVRFEDGYGLKAGDPVRYRGIDVGEVTKVSLNDSVDGIEVMLRLAPDSQRLAREGSKFWIERPRIGLTRISGLDTVVGAKYVSLLPGPQSAPVVKSFEGLSAPPVLQDVATEQITVRFLQGHGLAVGDPLKHRGIVVGEVTAVELSESLDGVIVRVQLLSSARAIARVGTQFWIERPKVSLAGTRGLDTLVGGRYLAVIPGGEDAAPQQLFEGLEMAAAADERPEGGLEIVLESPTRHGLEIGAPVSYRGLAIGHVLEVRLAADSSVVETRVYVQPGYTNLIRDNSRFWSSSGFDLDLGLTGFSLTAETLATIAAGGVAVATPDSAGSNVVTGHRFALHAKAEEAWRTWQPHLALGNPLAPHLAPLPRPLRASLRWKERRFGFTRQRQRLGWVLPLDSGRFLGPADLTTIPATALDQTATLEVAGQQIVLTQDGAEMDGSLARIRFPTGMPPLDGRWNDARSRVAQQPEDSLFIPGWHEPSTVLAAVQLKRADGHWTIDSRIPIPEDLHGAAVLSLVDGRLIGLITVADGTPRVALMTKELSN